MYQTSASGSRPQKACTFSSVGYSHCVTSAPAVEAVGRVRTVSHITNNVLRSLNLSPERTVPMQPERLAELPEAVQVAVLPDRLDVDLLTGAADAAAGDGDQLLLHDAEPPALLVVHEGHVPEAGDHRRPGTSPTPVWSTCTCIYL